MRVTLTAVGFMASFMSALAVPIANIESHLMRRNYTTDTSNQLTDGTACRAVTVIYARGTWEDGNVGSTTDVGLETFNDLAQIIGEDNLALQGVDYPATAAGFEEGGDSTGSQLMANLTVQASTQCPNTKLVISGYSQGGQLVHNAADLLSAEVTEFVSAVLIYGDPDNGQPVGNISSSIVKVYCHVADGICAGLGILTPTHGTYDKNALEAAEWIATTLGYS
ncbi:hypothetical protein N0V82_003422 [Gnomoniopsis sp. IMI 355080]|nr:hypothetical protein N0V82_003422 [Gnomoniopsis sp. IMI 355080]